MKGDDYTMLGDQHIRNAEYHEMTEILDSLYSKSKNGEHFKNLTSIIASEDNIILAYRNIKTNKGSKTPGVDNKTIDDISNMTVQQVQNIIISKINDYKPKPVKRKEIPKHSGKTRPLGIPCIIDRLFQQCIKQVLEPICEAKFYNYSFGFRPNRSVSQAIARTYFLMQKNKLPYCVDIDIKGFFDNIDHATLIKQIWNMGIQDKKLISIIKAMLKAEIVMPDKTHIIPEKGSPQGGILSPLLANIVLNDLDWWIASQWHEFKTRKNYDRIRIHGSKTYVDKSNKYTELKRASNLKEMYIVRYADDFKILCRNYSDAKKVFEATKQWLKARLKLEISEGKSGITNLKQKYTEYLGFKIKLKEKSGKWVVQSHVNEKSMERIKTELINIINEIKRTSDNKTFYEKLNRYNATVLGIHQFYKVATDISIDFQRLGLEMEKIIYNRLGSRYKITRDGKFETNSIIRKNYEKSSQMRFINGRPIIPIAYIKTQPPSSKVQEETPYSPQGRELLNNEIKKGFDISIVRRMLNEELFDSTVAFRDNRISLYCAQRGRCAITGKVLEYDEMHCHHNIPKEFGGTDEYKNLIIVTQKVHTLIHATSEDTIQKYISVIENQKHLDKINKLRRLCKLNDIEAIL